MDGCPPADYSRRCAVPGARYCELQRRITLSDITARSGGRLSLMKTYEIMTIV